MNLKDLVISVLNGASNTFDGNKTIIPFFLFEDEKGEFGFMAAPFTDEKSKDMMSARAKAIFKERKAVRYAFFSESWMVYAKDDKEWEALKRRAPDRNIAHVSKHPDRVEVLVCIGEDRIKRQKAFSSRNILRPEHGPATLSPMKDVIIDDLNYHKGRFSSLLPD